MKRIASAKRCAMPLVDLSPNGTLYSAAYTGPARLDRIIQGGRKNTGGSKYLLCNDYFSTMRAATDKRSSPVERADQVSKGWSLKQRLGPLKSRNDFYENPLVSCYCQFPDNSLEWFSALKSYSLKSSNILARTQRQALQIRFLFVLNVKIFIRNFW